MPHDNVFDPNPTLEDLAVLIGSWEMELSNAAFLPDPSATVKGKVSFEWLEDGAFLMLRMGDRLSEAPHAIWLMHRDDSSSAYKVFYYDDRKVSRIYEMSFSGNIWKLWREAPNFSQRFEGKLTQDQNKIVAKWENSSDGQDWKHDFDVTYTRLK